MAIEPLVTLSRHAAQRMAERGASPEEVIRAIATGDRSSERSGRARFRLSIPGVGRWAEQDYDNRVLDVIAVPDAPNAWTVVTVVVRYSWTR